MDESKENTQKEYEKESFLMNVKDDMEANIIKGLLESNDIPSLKRHKEAGDYLFVYMGTSSFGIDIFVPESALERAREIIKNQPQIEDDFEEDK